MVGMLKLQHTFISAITDFNKNFEVEIDASGYGLGAVLSQDGHHIAFFSKTLGVRARLKSIYQKEFDGYSPSIAQMETLPIG